MDLWAYQNGVRIDFSRPGKPTDNAYIETFNGTLRAECLDTHWFGTLAEAKERIEAWRKEYNESRPHRALGERTPKEFAHGIAAIGPCISNVLYEPQKKRTMAEEGTEQGLVGLHRPGVPMSHGGQLCNFESGTIGEGVHFQIGPEVLDRVEFRRVSGQEEWVQMIGTFHKVSRAFGAVGVEAIPEQYAGPLQFEAQVAQEANDLSGADLSLRVKAKVKSHSVSAGGHAQTSQGRYLFQTTPALDQHRRPSPGLPTAAHQRPHQQAAFIEENQPGVQPVRFFLRAGQVCLIHFRISSSSRSTARRAGFWGLQPSEWSKRPIWST